MSGTREENVFMARMAEQAERYEDMVTYMTRVANMGAELSLEERNLLSVAYKNAIGSRRLAARSIANGMAKEHPSNPLLPSIQQYKTKVDTELVEKCGEIINLLKKADGLIATASTAEAQVFYLKMEGDYHRYLAELYAPSGQHGDHAKNAFESYSRATQIADPGLPPTHAIRLGLALNFAVFYYEVYQQKDMACQLAKASFEAAAPGLGSMPDEERRDAEAIMQLLRDNLVLWQQPDSADGKAPEQDLACEDL